LNNIDDLHQTINNKDQELVEYVTQSEANVAEKEESIKHHQSEIEG
jgi:hypothetical protein